MAFRITADDLAGPDGLSQAGSRDMARAVTAGVREGTGLLKDDLRRETASAFNGNRLPRAWRSAVYPKGQNSSDAAGFVQVRNSAAAIIDSARKATVIRSTLGIWLAIPTDAAGKHGLKAGAGGFGVTTNSRGARERITPGGFVRRTGMKLRFVYEGGRRGGKRAFLVVDQAQRTRGLAAPYRGKGRGAKLYGPSGQTIVVFTLVRQVTTKKRLDLDAITARTAAILPDLILKRWS